MRNLFFILFVSLVTLVQSQNSTNLITNQTPCTFEMTVEQLTAKELIFKCEDIFEAQAFTIENFRIKFRGSASIPVKGNTLNAKSHKEAKSLKTGDFVTIFYKSN